MLSTALCRLQSLHADMKPDGWIAVLYLTTVVAQPSLGRLTICWVRGASISDAFLACGGGIFGQWAHAAGP
jgi:hypothetical protein